MRATLAMIEALGQPPFAEPVLMVLFGSALIMLAAWLRRAAVNS